MSQRAQLGFLSAFVALKIGFLSETLVCTQISYHGNKWPISHRVQETQDTLLWQVQVGLNGETVRREYLRCFKGLEFIRRDEAFLFVLL